MLVTFKRLAHTAIGRAGYAIVTLLDIERLEAQRRDSCRALSELTHIRNQFIQLTSNCAQLTSECAQLTSERNHWKQEYDASRKSIETDRDYQVVMAIQNTMAGIDDLDPGFRPIYDFCRKYTMTSIERLYALYKSTEYVVKAGIQGDILECGVWRGGSVMLVARTLIALGVTDRRLYLFDTFEGHPRPDSEKDVDLWGNHAVVEFEKYKKSEESSDWGTVTIDEVRENMASTGYPVENLVFVKGMVEKTAADNIPDKLALLRLDTDWYNSARDALKYFYPVLSRGGVLIVDDYGHYVGQRLAVDEYFVNAPVLLNRIDYSCRTVQKQE